MKHNYLLPHRYKNIGWFILIPALILGVTHLFFYEMEGDYVQRNVFAIVNNELFSKTQYFTMVSTNVVDEIAGIGIIIGGLLVAFSKEKVEDEFIARLRLESLMWATYVNYGILALAMLFIYGMAFFWVM
ncbi:MAG: hypothetical protein M3Q97_09950, partial [Bacteroidota bacterium]|nr:hypothetical protein [Bacteroidota bacterium]